MSNIMDGQELAERLTNTIRGLEDGRVRVPVAKEIANSAGKLIKMAADHILYHKMLGTKDKKMPFYEKGF